MTRMNPFYFATSIAMTDVFNFNEHDTLLDHHRLLLGSVPDKHYENQLIEHVLLRQFGAVRTTLHKLAIVPILYKYGRHVLEDAIDVVRLLADHGAHISERTSATTAISTTTSSAIAPGAARYE
ncbi:hypothetical protein SPRG_17450 [Saprolegnia parasitica CBS 223.65]|uniref:Uncharacterized protein n=1 Tax=Saprolegnia parasitica (strain CBS 223.65) TaxID=695850 RepID=A0A067BS93_SAPPC|nr:hypothetical protein SPRG_17450 [Saprolegnia parasitica CBS 223.65]KDO17151.1 hypothetical protein SPRG_17450 [Saprolegnia parasitica CBS 223.65]|eukprot:XP_012212142.1 hypothetical protein SPRG_17450 [Saprolegnia parasitica CBS 223.65]